MQHIVRGRTPKLSFKTGDTTVGLKVCVSVTSIANGEKYSSLTSLMLQAPARFIQEVEVVQRFS